MSQIEATPGKQKREMGMLAGVCMLIGLACLGVTALSVLNVAFDLNLAIGSHGSTTALPNNWEEVAGLGAASVFIIALSWYGSFVVARFKDAKGRPLVRALIIVGALALLTILGRGVQILALTSTYGSMLAYYCTDAGSIEDVKGELEGATPEALDRCLSRSAQWDRHDLLETVIGAGANFQDETSEYRSCVLSSEVSLAYIEKAIELGATPDTCAKSEALIQEKLRWKEAADDEELAKLVEMLLKAGWSPDARGEPEEKSALELAQEAGMKKTVALLQR